MGLLSGGFSPVTLYPSLPRKEARIAVESALQESNDADINTNTILQMMDFILENNNF